jgi:hypothetical protein
VLSERLSKLVFAYGRCVITAVPVPALALRC